MNNANYSNTIGNVVRFESDLYIHDGEGYCQINKSPRATKNIKFRVKRNYNATGGGSILIIRVEMNGNLKEDYNFNDFSGNNDVYDFPTIENLFIGSNIVVRFIEMSDNFNVEVTGGIENTIFFTDFTNNIEQVYEIEATVTNK